MNLNMMNMLVGKAMAEREGLSESRSFQLGMLAGMMPSMQGLMIAAMIARRERPEAAKPPVGVTDVTGKLDAANQAAIQAKVAVAEAEARAEVAAAVAAAAAKVAAAEQAAIEELKAKEAASQALALAQAQQAQAQALTNAQQQAQQVLAALSQSAQAAQTAQLKK